MTRQILAKTILNKTKRRDPWFLDDYTLNPFSGCAFNCLYCYIRGSKYGINMEERLSIKSNAGDLLDKQLRNRARKNEYGRIVLASATDPYLQTEKHAELTRRLLEVILLHRFPIHIITKSDLVLRDIDLLRSIDERAFPPKAAQSNNTRGVMVTFSFSTHKKELAKIFEPGAPEPQRRINALQKYRSNGFLTGASLMPLLPFITDTEEQLEALYQQLSLAGAQYALPASLTLFGSGPSDSQTLVFNAIAKHFPELESKYKSLFSDRVQLPHTYRNALRRKVERLSAKYGLPMWIGGA